MATETCTTYTNPSSTCQCPATHVETVPTSSSFKIRPADRSLLESADAFRIRRPRIRQQSFCPPHSVCSASEKETWILQRDITQVLVLPIFNAYREASCVAQRVLGNRNVYDRELAFRGEARGNFSWLQCLFVEEDEWLAATGCPACSVTLLLQSEPHIRLVIAATRLSSLPPSKEFTTATTYSAVNPLVGAPGTPPMSPVHKGQPIPTALPSFDFWRSSLRQALDKDSFWGPQCGRDIEAKAENLDLGIRELVRQCTVLRERE